ADDANTQAFSSHEFLLVILPCGASAYGRRRVMAMNRRSASQVDSYPYLFLPLSIAIRPRACPRRTRTLRLSDLRRDNGRRSAGTYPHSGADWLLVPIARRFDEDVHTEQDWVELAALQPRASRSWLQQPAQTSRGCAATCP